MLSSTYLVPEVWPFGDLERGAYGVLLVDPPWTFKTYSEKGLTKSPQAHYACMTPEAIAALPVGELAAPDCALAMWATAPCLPQAILLMAAWGFAHKTAGAWAKRSSTGSKWAFGTGYVYRSASEFWLLGTRGKPRSAVRDIRNLIVAPVREHSRKPDQMHVDLERMFPDARKAELFARAPRPGWSVWGNQADRFAALPAALATQFGGLPACAP